MLLSLSTKFRRHIALFLYGILYGQFLMAAESLRLSGPIVTWRETPLSIRDNEPLPAALDHTPMPFPGSVTLAKRPTPTPAGSPSSTREFGGGPTQPEMQAFQSVNANNMVDLFSGDFSYNIPLMDVGGYPVNISYHSGISMDEDASWVGLGWNVNPGSVTRNMRGLPDDFNGGSDTVTRVANVKPNVTVGGSASAGKEIIGLPMFKTPKSLDSATLAKGTNVSGSVSLGIFHTTYTGWGMEAGVNASINAGAKAHGPLSGGLSITDNSQNGLTISPSLSYNLQVTKATETGGFAMGFQLSLPYNSRTGIKSLELGLNDKQNVIYRNKLRQAGSGVWSTGISFAGPTYTPTITMPYTNLNYSFTAKAGFTQFAADPNFSISAYGGKEYIAPADTSLSLPAYGYLNFQNRGNNWAALTDFNREKEMAYRESPAIPHIAVPAYTYDVFSISGEGTGGMFRAYRGDVGFIADHLISTKTTTDAGSIDLSFGNSFHGGVDFNHNYSTTQTGPWIPNNNLKNSIAFRSSDGLYEASYFRNPGEKTTNTSAFYKAIGDDDVVAASLDQPGGNNGSVITASNILYRYNNKKLVGRDTLPLSGVIKTSRDKRSEVISYLTAAEASQAGLDKYIYHYAVNKFAINHCQDLSPVTNAGDGKGLDGFYYDNNALAGTPKRIRHDTAAFFNWDHTSAFPGFPRENFSVRWLGKLKAPATGAYIFGLWTDDGVRLWIGDSLLIDNWTYHSPHWDTSHHINLIAGTFYNVRLEYFQGGGHSQCQLGWKRPDMTVPGFNQDHNPRISTPFLYPPDDTDTVDVDTILTRENRVNNFRKPSHISEVDVLNPDGRRYVYGIPVYNLQQKEVSFSVNKAWGNQQTGLTAYDSTANSTHNTNGKDGYYSKDIIPSYAHSFLLTGMLSPDYVDLTGNGISDDDLGDAVRFNYSKTSGIANPYSWRAPYVKDSANYNEGFRSYSRDDKAHFISGIKELWYLHSIESKTMVATFTLKPRADMLEIDEHGKKYDSGKAMCLTQIDLYSKADLLAHPLNPRPIKTVHFEYSYELCRGINYPANDSGKLTLKRIWFTYNGNNKGVRNPYVFNYHQNNPRYRINMADKWGTYKDPLQNPGSTISNYINNAEYPYALQDSTLAAYNAGAWTLDSIQLPSGGRIKVNYESDDYAYVQNRRATQMFKIAGFGADATGHYNSDLYAALGDQMYVYIKTPAKVSSNKELYARYLEDIGKLYLRLYVRMPNDDFGSGSEYVPVYADLDTAATHWYGITDDNTIWIKVKGVNETGNAGGIYSPMVQTATNFLRLNLPSKAYPGAELNDDLNLADAVKMVISLVGNITSAVMGFSNTARFNGWSRQADLNRSYVRLDNPFLKKMGGGLRVKSILIYDNWNAMTKKKETVYGQAYSYTTTQLVNGVPTQVSSGVASWEPAVGAEENPFHLPIEYVDRASILAPAATMYTEEPLGETFYPGANIGYSKVRVRTIHAAKVRSANGYSETSFFTSYDFPTTWDWSMLDNNTKKRFKPILSNFLRINARNYLNMSQGFKVELNDMNGKLRKEAVYSETDTSSPVSYMENFYKVDNLQVQSKHLNNRVSTIDPNGNIDTAATIGKDIELMGDMRDQTSTSVGANINLNTDFFIAGAWPVILPSLFNLYQKETNQFRSVAMMKIVQRYGILDSVVRMDKGSHVSSKNLLYDAETGDPLLIRTQNEFNDPVFLFSYPSHWVYKGIGPAYQNIDAVLSHLTVKQGKITGGLSRPDSTYLTAGDELLVYSKPTTNIVACQDDSSYFPNPTKLWVVDTNIVHNTQPDLFLVDQYGTPFSGHDLTLKVIRSGHRNSNGDIGSITSLNNPIVADAGGQYHLRIDTSTRVITAAANEMQQYWKVTDEKRSDNLSSCIYTSEDSAKAAAEGCSCLKPFFNYLLQSRFALTSRLSQRMVKSLVDSANAHGAGINLNACPIFSDNANQVFYSTINSNKTVYTANIGRDIFNITSQGGPMILNKMVGGVCDAAGNVIYKNPDNVLPPPDTITAKIYPVSSVNLFSSVGSTCPAYVDNLLQIDSTSDHIMVENSLSINNIDRSAVSILRFDQPIGLPVGATPLSAKLVLQADQRGHIPGTYNNANSVNPSDSIGYSLASPTGWFPGQPLDTMLYQAYYSPWYSGVKNTTPFQNDTVDVLSYLNGNYNSGSFILTQGWAGLHTTDSIDSARIAKHAVPPYLTSGYSNNYATFYSQRYSDQTKWPAIIVTYIAPPLPIDTSGAVLRYNATLSCNNVAGRSCYSAVTDTVVNPYQYGILGNFRPQRSYVYYGRRKESDLTDNANVRTAGTISNFAPFWTIQNGKWTASYDTSRWIWNSQSTLFNRKGFELENNNPLGIFGAGLYGYQLTMPTAVIQNSRYQESAFDGFEDYSFSANTCDNPCPETRPFDFTPYVSHMTTEMAHTGLYSLRIDKDSAILMPVSLSATPPTDQQLTTGLIPDNCTTTRLEGIRASANSILPPFSPFAGKKMLIGGWVKEANSCTCQSYSRNHIVVSFSKPTGDTSITLSPSGNMIEGWQRYEVMVTIPAGATGLTLRLQSSDSSTTYFDDIRIHPFNAEMKSYVYNPVNLRMMASMDENNYATFYEYDDDGTLIRVKKETERGIQTVKETRSALLKDQ
jgi:hypothetical protein